MPTLQELVYRFETMRSARGWRIGLGIVFAVIMVVGYNWRSFHNMNNPEAMDAAQVARNLAEGRGFTTQFIRPFSIHLVKQRNEAKSGNDLKAVASDPARLKGPHPDLANPPVYPVVLAGLMKILPFKYPVKLPFQRYQPDFLIALFNQVLLLASVVLTFFLARRLFDNQVAWLTAILVFGCEQLWRFSMSGLSTQLLLLIFLGLIWCLVWLESEAREPAWGSRAQLWLAGAVGLLLGLGALTRYAFGWLVIPVLIYLGMCCVARRAQVMFITLGVFLLVLSPWVMRNLNVSRTPFGTASYAAYETTFLFPEHKLERSLTPSFILPPGRPFMPFVIKFAENSREILQNELPKLGGSWVSALFLTGLLLGYRSPALRRLRILLIGTLLMFIVIQSLGRTQLSLDSPVINGENLLVLTVPLVLLFGTGLFFQLLDQMSFETVELRYVAIGAFGFVVCLPMLYCFLPPRTSPVAYPPYDPPRIQQTCGWMNESELMMSDIPWAVAWYGDRQCLWLTQNAKSEFFAVNDYLKPVRALYLTPETIDKRFLTQWIHAGEHNWGSFVFEKILRDRIADIVPKSQLAPSPFPLRAAAPGFFPEQLFLTDWERWKTTSSGPETPVTEVLRERTPATPADPKAPEK